MGRKPKSTGREFFKYWGLGFEFAAAVGLGFYLGFKADQHYGHDPWGLLIGGAIGFAAGMYLLIKSSAQMMRELDGTDENQESPR